MATLELTPPDLGFVPNYLEHTDDPSPMSAGMGYDGGRASVPHDITDPELDGAFVDLLGYTKVAPYGPGLVRKCPKAHARWPWLYASRVSNIQGIGKPSRASGNAFFEANAMKAYAAWPVYRLTVEYEPRPYYVLGDAKIPTGTVSWYDENNAGRTNNYAAEWLRYCDYDVLPKPELITSQLGQMKFYTESGASPGRLSGGLPVGGTPYPGFLRMTVPQAEIALTWYQVPYIYLNSPNSRLVSYVGYVNYNDWFSWKRGELIYLGCTAKKYTPVSPDFQPDAISGFASLPARMCDITMHFLYTKRPGTDVPTPSNPNKVAAGHNLVPWLRDRTFRYVSGANGLDSDPPLFYSRPFELLFSNPDA